MKRKLTVVSAATADPIFRRKMMTAAVVIGFALAWGCSSSPCHRCHRSKSRNCHQRVCQTMPTPLATTVPSCGALADSSDIPPAMDDMDLTTKPVMQPGFGSQLPEDTPEQPWYGHGENYEWLIGVLQRVHVPRKSWKVRYAPLDQQDKWGGSVVPAPDVRMDEFEDGEVVYVEGEIIGDRASLYVSGPRYRITTIRRVNEGDASRVSTNR